MRYVRWLIIGTVITLAASWLAVVLFPSLPELGLPAGMALGLVFLLLEVFEKWPVYTTLVAVPVWTALITIVLGERLGLYACGSCAMAFTIVGVAVGLNVGFGDTPLWLVVRLESIGIGAASWDGFAWWWIVVIVIGFLLVSFVVSVVLTFPAYGLACIVMGYDDEDESVDRMPARQEETKAERNRRLSAPVAKYWRGRRID